MNIHVLTVTNKGSASKPSPGIYFSGKWLTEIGFIPGALVQSIPEPGGVAFTLCNEDIRSYSELDTATRERGGKLIQLSYTYGKKCPFPHLTTMGQYLQKDAGLGFGDSLIAHYAPGVIQVRKLPKGVKVIHMTSIKDQLTGKASPKLRLYGAWLAELGFTPDALVTALSEPGRVTLQLMGKTDDNYSDIVRFARQNKMKLVQVHEAVRRGKPYPYIITAGPYIDKSGFASGDTLLASCGHGTITLQKYSPEGLGF